MASSESESDEDSWACLESVSEESSALASSQKPSEPVGRRGQWSVVHKGKFYRYGGYSGDNPRLLLVDHHIDVFDFAKCAWSVIKTGGHTPMVVSGACSSLIGDCLYMFGGWHRGVRNADVYELSLVDFQWKKLTDVVDHMKGNPLCKDKAGMVDYGTEMLCIMGGYGHSMYHFRAQKGASYHLDTTSYMEICWTNELHLFHINSREWISPELTGVRPPPCAAFSFTRVDQHRAVLFGGRQLELRTDQLHILDMENWHWSGAILPSGPDAPWPQKRSFHAACSLVDPNCSHFNHTSPIPPPSSERKHPWLPCPAPDLSTSDKVEGCSVDPKLLVLWGMNNDGDPINDAWILNVNTLTWKTVNLGGFAGPARIWHSMGAYHPVSHSAVAVTVGGSDQNLFKIDDETMIHNVGTTSLLTFGVSDLFELALKFIAEHVVTFSPLLKQLPPRILEAVRQERRMLDKKKYYYSVNCSISS